MRVNLYLGRETALDRLHPQVKVGILAATFASVYGIGAPLLLVPIVVGLAALLVWAEALPNVRRFAPMFVAVPITSFLVWTFFYGYGQSGAAAWGPRPRAEAVEFAAAMAMKLETFLGASVLFLSITRVEEFTEALRGFGLPYRVSFTIALAFRLVPLFLGSSLSVVTAQRARGLDFSRGNVFQRLARYVPVIVPVFMGALRRADGMAMALESRGFGRGAPRSTFVRSRFRPVDALAVALLSAIVVLYVSLAWAGTGRMALS